jgi:peptide-methionine (S)-S-oxide reductase
MAPWPKPGEEDLPRATFAAGCFWGPELLFQRVPGVVSTAVGYTGGHVENPTYEQVCSGRTGHTEAVEMTFKPDEVTYQQLVDKFYENHDPTTLNRQKNDVGTQYRSGIYYRTDEEKQIAEAGKAKIPGAVTEIAQLTTFYPAESYHQQYLENGGRGGRKQSARKECNDPIRCYG